MIRITTAICMIAAAGSGLYLYHQKHLTQMLEKQIRATVAATIQAQRRSHVLSAEWDLTNDPERLAKLADQFLTLRTMAPGQFAAVAELPSRLPPPRAAGWKPEQTTEEPVEGDVDSVAEAPLPIPPRHAPPPQMASPRPLAGSPGVALAAHQPTANQPALASGPSASGPSASFSPASSSPATMRPAVASASPPAAAAPSPRAAPQPTRSASMPVRAQAEPSASAQTSFTAGGSMGGSTLGMARATQAAPAPVPISVPGNFIPTGN